MRNKRINFRNEKFSRFINPEKGDMLIDFFVERTFIINGVTHHQYRVNNKSRKSYWKTRL